MSVKIIRALNRGLDVLQIVQAMKAASLHDLHLATKLPKPTLLCILKTLMGRDLVWQRIADSAYLTPSQSVPARSTKKHISRRPLLPAFTKPTKNSGSFLLGTISQITPTRGGAQYIDAESKRPRDNIIEIRHGLFRRRPCGRAGARPSWRRFGAKSRKVEQNFRRHAPSWLQHA
jgi:IclR-like helix-turn-helix domain-containing protein